MVGVRGVNGGLLRRLHNLGFECLLLPASGEALDGSIFNYVRNCSVAGNNLTKNGGGGAFNAGAESSQVLYGNGSVSFTTAEANTDKLAGLTRLLGPTYDSIDIAVYLNGGGAWVVFESGVAAYNPAEAYVAGDVFKVDVNGGVFRCYKNGVLRYTSGLTPHFPLRLGANLFTQPSTICNAVLTGFTDYYRAASALDISKRQYAPAVADDFRRPLIVPGDPAYWRCDRYRGPSPAGDRLNAAVVPLGANPYTAVLIFKCASAPGVGEYFTPWANGVPYVDGQAMIVEPVGTKPLKMYHWAAGITHELIANPGTTLHSVIARWDGADLRYRVDGVDNGPFALAAPTAPSTRLAIGCHDNAGLFAFDGDIGLVGLATRNFSDADKNELAAITLAGWGV